jgi:hypothetical protein
MIFILLPLFVPGMLALAVLSAQIKGIYFAALPEK